MSDFSKLSEYRKMVSGSFTDAEIPDLLFSIEYMMRHISEYATENGMNNTLRALDVMKRFHKGAYRKGNEHVPYIVHPLMVANHAIELGLADDELLAVCLLHDVLEDSEATINDLDMPESIAEAVELLSFDKNSIDIYKAKENYYNRIAGNRNASIVKVLDRCNNISNMTKAFSKDRMAEYIKETEEFILPILEMLLQEQNDIQSAVFILKYHILSVTESIKKLI